MIDYNVTLDYINTHSDIEAGLYLENELKKVATRYFEAGKRVAREEMEDRMTALEAVLKSVTRYTYFLKEEITKETNNSKHRNKLRDELGFFYWKILSYIQSYEAKPIKEILERFDLPVSVSDEKQSMGETPSEERKDNG